MYYCAMILDPILRFNWVFYAIFPLEIQHSALLSFVVALTEVLRRGMWTLFRVENEHCTNVGRFRAWRDVPLPYDLSSGEVSARVSLDSSKAATEVDGIRPPPPRPQPHGVSYGGTQVQQSPAGTYTTSTDLEASRTRSSTRARTGRGRGYSFADSSSPIPRGLSRVGSLLHAAHAQDFERKRKLEQDDHAGPGTSHADDTDEEEDEEEDHKISEGGSTDAEMEDAVEERQAHGLKREGESGVDSEERSHFESAASSKRNIAHGDGDGVGGSKSRT